MVITVFKNSLERKDNNNNQFIYKNRGMDLEELLNSSNDYYLDIDKAVIYKKPTPIGVVKVSYQGNHKIINKGYFKEQSTLDYNGLYKGKYIDFEAKVTHNKTSFPLNNIHPHQIAHMKKVIKHGGICFLVIMMNEIVYLLPGVNFVQYVETTTRKSIPYEFIKNNAYEIKYGINPVLDYLSVVEKIYFRGEF